MVPMRSVGLSLVVTLAAGHFHDPAKFKPLIDACAGLETLASCTAAKHGVCKTDEDTGARSCDWHHHWHHGHFWHHGHHDSDHDHKERHGHDGHPIWHEIVHHAKAAAKKMGIQFPGNHTQWPVHLGDCGSKNDGESCTIQSEGQCIPSGKCPMFRGEMVCRANDVHPPDFVTAACKDKKEGDDCKMMMLLPGKCEKPKYLFDMFCKVQWQLEDHVNDMSNATLVV